MAIQKLVTEGSGKKIFEDESPDYIILEFKDHLIDKKSKSITKVKDKGSINTSISVNLFEYLNSYNILNHYMKRTDENLIIVKKLDMIPLEILIRNYAAGKFCKMYGFKEGECLKSPVLEFYLKDEKLKKPQICESLIYAKEIALTEEVLSIKNTACKANAILKTYFERRNLNLVDIQLEFGRDNGQIMLGDEISLDTCTLWDTVDNNTNSNNKNMNSVYKMLHERILGEN